MSATNPINLFWFRRDLRLNDNAGLYHALHSNLPVLPLFIFDQNILNDLDNRRDGRVEFIHNAIENLKTQLRSLGSDLLVIYGKPEALWPEILRQYAVKAVFTNRDYEPYAEQRDGTLEKLLSTNNIPFHTFKDHVLFEKDEVLKDDGKPYTVFTPYSKKWRAKLESRMWKQQDNNGETETLSYFLASYPNQKYFNNFWSGKTEDTPSLKVMGFEPSGMTFPPDQVAQSLIKNYDKRRDFPAVDGTSRLGIHYRFGTISIREKARKAQALNTTYLNELIWRDFYSQILAHFPHVANQSFKPAYDRIPWREAPADFQRWCEGKTGYPIVDAGMRQLNATGFMHNRVRMITASFLTKHLLIDWRQGEAYFAKKLLDYDLASNSGGWQWAAGCGTDAAPYFRIFNPSEQTKKFDPDLRYIRRWVPEYGTPTYPNPMVDHKMARERCLETYKAALG